MVDTREGFKNGSSTSVNVSCLNHESYIEVCRSLRYRFWLSVGLMLLFVFVVGYYLWLYYDMLGVCLIVIDPPLK